MEFFLFVIIILYVLYSFYKAHPSELDIRMQYEIEVMKQTIRQLQKDIRR
jgi:hypothetical protein